MGKKIPCLTDLELTNYKTGEMPFEQLTDADDHIQECEHCRSRLLSPSEMAEAIKNLHKSIFGGR